MKLKDIKRTATFAWDNSTSSAPLIATGAIAGAIDADFSNESHLEIWKPNFADVHNIQLDAGGDAALGSITVNSRFNCLAWSTPTTSHIQGILAAGMETGEVSLYDPSKILAGDSADQARIYQNLKHTDAVRGLDFNPIQKNLVLTGAINAEVYIHDLNKPENEPLLPGQTGKLQGITALQWNPNVPRVFAASSSAGFTSVWDVKAAKEIASLQYGGGAAKGMDTVGGIAGLQMGKRRGMSDVVWHPENPTRIITASEDDESPIIMFWDLRNTRAPERILSGHHKGVLSLSWCQQDTDLLLSCGKDNRTLCWNPQTGEMVGELPLSGDWSFQTSWCPRNPDLLATASFDGHIGIHSLQTTSLPPQNSETLSESATAEDVFGALSNQQPVESSANVLSLRQAPKWLRRPVSATFGFGGLLTSTSNLPGTNGGHQSGVVHLRTVTTEGDVFERAKKLSETNGNSEKLAEFCAQRAGVGAGDADDAWKALQTLFKANSREELVQLLGFSREEVARKVEEAILKCPGAVKNAASEDGEKTPIVKPEDGQVTPVAEKSLDVTDPDQEAKSVAPEPENEDVESAPSAAEDAIAKSPSRSLFDDDNSADFFTSIASAPADDSHAHGTALRNPTLNALISSKSEIGDSSAAATVGSASSVRDDVVEKENNFQIYPAGEGDIDKLITQALVVGDFKSAVDLCIASSRFADALLLSIRGGPELLQSTQAAYFAKQTISRPFLRVYQSIVTEDLVDIVQNADLGEWKVIFVVLCTFAKDGEFAGLAEQLGQRLQFRWRLLAGSESPESKENARIARRDATLCYLAARKLEKLISIWVDELHEEEEVVEATPYTARAQALQSFIEKVSIFIAATSYTDDDLDFPSTAVVAESGARQYKLNGLYDRYLEYADVLATQGLLDVAEVFVKRVPADYVGGGIEKVRERVLGAGSKTEVSKISVSKQQALRGYGQNAQSYVPAQTQRPYGQPTPASVRQQPAPMAYQPAAPAPSQINSPYAPPPTQSSVQPQPSPQHSGHAPRPSFGNNPYAPPPSTFQPVNHGSSNGYRSGESQPQGYGGYGQTGAGVNGVNVPPPPRVGEANGPLTSAASTPAPSQPPVLPAAQRRDIPGWNDAPAFAPKRPASAAAKEVRKTTPITSPFPNVSNPYAVPSPAPGTPGVSGVTSLPPGRAPSAVAPPPKNARPPSAVSKMHPPPPPAMQHQQSQQQVQQPQQQYGQQMPPPQQQQQYQQQPQHYGVQQNQQAPQQYAVQQQQSARPPMQSNPSQVGPPPSAARQPPTGARAGPPIGTLAGPPPPGRALSPLNPGAKMTSSLATHGVQNGSGISPPLFRRPPSRPGQGIEGLMGGPPPPGSRMAGPPPPGRT